MRLSILFFGSALGSFVVNLSVRLSVCLSACLSVSVSVSLSCVFQRKLRRDRKSPSRSTGSAEKRPAKQRKSDYLVMVRTPLEARAARPFTISLPNFRPALIVNN